MQLTPSASGEYCCLCNLNLYDSPTCKVLATQASRGRHLRLISPTPTGKAIEVCLVEDGYIAWLSVDDLSQLQPAEQVYQSRQLKRSDIIPCLPQVIAFAQAAQLEPNYYLWGGTVAPNYDCSGLIQAAFAASGIWLPRDSYQQADFTQLVSLADSLPGDLVFFAENNRVNHVALYLGDGLYIHSSGKKIGRNGIGIDLLSDQGDKVSCAYYQIFWCMGRVENNYQLKTDI